MLEWIFQYNSEAARPDPSQQMEIVRKIQELAKTTLYLLGSNMPDAFTPDHFMKSAPLTEHMRLCILVNYAYRAGNGEGSQVNAARQILFHARELEHWHRTNPESNLLFALVGDEEAFTDPTTCTAQNAPIVEEEEYESYAVPYTVSWAVNLQALVKNTRGYFAIEDAAGAVLARYPSGELQDVPQPHQFPLQVMLFMR